MRSKDLIAVNGKLYEYVRYNKKLQLHITTEINIDDEGKLIVTHATRCFTDSELSNRGIYLTKKQWIGLTKYFLCNRFNIPEEGIACDIVDSFAATRTPLVEELPNYIEFYLA